MSPFSPVIPAEAGTQGSLPLREERKHWVPAFAGMTTGEG
jgi:hypothetical protein